MEMPVHRRGAPGGEDAKERAQEEAIPHDASSCELVACGRCDDHGDGYARGTGRAHLELRQWEPGAHAVDCGCDGCVTVRAVLAAAG